MKNTLAAILLVLDVVLPILSFPNGVPKTHHVCKTLRPHHNSSLPQNSSSPYVITTSKDRVPIDTAVEVSLVSKGGIPFKGFIMLAQMHPIRKDKPLGSFALVDPSRSKLMNCLFLPKSAVCHSSPVNKTSISFKWTPPPKFSGSVYFVATFVQSFSVYWAKEMKEIIVGGFENEINANLPTSTEIEEDNVFEILPLVLDTPNAPYAEVYDDCGTRKKCFGLPRDCVEMGSCDAMVTIVVRETKFEFELIGKDSDCATLSVSQFDTNISVFECIVLHSNISLHDLPVNNSLEKYYYSSPENETELLNSSYIDGTLHCKFVKNMESKIVEMVDNWNTIYALSVTVRNTEREEELSFEKMYFDVREINSSDTSTSIIDEKRNEQSFHKQNYKVNRFLLWFYNVLLFMIRIV